MSRRSRRSHSGSDEEATFELDLSPLLALMVTLIPIMLLATVFVKVTVVESDIPQLVKEAIEKDRKKKEREVTVHLFMKEKVYNLEVRIDGKSESKKKIIMTSTGDWDNETLHKEFVTIKRMHPKVFRVDLYPSEEVSYQEIVKVMDEARDARKEEGLFQFTDEKSKKSVETKVMFPDVIFSNVVEG